LLDLRGREVNANGADGVRLIWGQQLDESPARPYWPVLRRAFAWRGRKEAQHVSIARPCRYRLRSLDKVRQSFRLRTDPAPETGGHSTGGATI
jgi:hypothetical protein